MKVFAFCQAYNEADFIIPYLSHIYGVIDHLIISEGRLTPFGTLSFRSADKTLKLIKDFAKQRDKIILSIPTEKDFAEAKNREKAEGLNKNKMLKLAERFGIKNNDLIMIGDIDEFWNPRDLQKIFNYFRENSDKNSGRVYEYQFAYGLKYCFMSSHGRFFRYKPKSLFKTTNHYCYSNKHDLGANPDITFPFKDTHMYHLSYAKHPLRIREKVLSFNRPSFTTWYNNCYLHPDNLPLAYKNNKALSQQCGWKGGGWAEGQEAPLIEFKDKLPPVLDQFKDWDWIPYIKKNRKKLKI